MPELSVTEQKYPKGKYNGENKFEMCVKDWILGLLFEIIFLLKIKVEKIEKRHSVKFRISINKK